MSPAPLENFKILDLTRFLAGPYCTMVLAEFGADVIKIERFPGGDDSRRLSPIVKGESYAFAMPNRSKRSIAVNLKSAEGRDLFLRLVAEADLVVENFRPGVVERLGIGYDACRTIREDVLYCSISGFGQSGPYRDRPGFDIIAQGLTGFMRMTGQPGGPPNKVGIAINDVAAGVTAAYSILAAELARRQTGEGQYIDVSLVEAGLAWTVWESGAYFGAGEVPEPEGTRHRQSAPYQAYRTADGYVTIGASTDHLWRRLITDVFDRPGWADDARFRTMPDRVAHVDELEREIEAITTTRTTADWVDRLDAAGVPGGPVLTYDQTLADPHVIAREAVVEVEHPIVGTMRTIRPPARFSTMDVAVRGPAPWLGQHTTEVLVEHGLTDDEIDHLYRVGVVFDQHRTTEAVR